MSAATEVLARLAGGLIVSCQAEDGEPLGALPYIVALAESARLGGATGLRLDGAAEVAAGARATGLPVIGIRKHRSSTGRPRITPDYADVELLARAGATVVALDASFEYQPDRGRLRAMVVRAAEELDVPLMADVATLAEAERAMACGVDIVATTLWGYTPETAGAAGPAIALTQELAGAGLPVIVEGRIGSPADVERAFDAGALAVVVGSAITNPVHLTRLFAAAAPATRSAGETVDDVAT